MDIKKNQRGFKNGKFIDLYGEECSIQISSLATDEAIWIGIDKQYLVVFEDENMGKYIETTLPKNWRVNTKMHLSREQVANLLYHLQKFVETGEI